VTWMGPEYAKGKNRFQPVDGFGNLFPKANNFFRACMWLGTEKGSQVMFRFLSLIVFASMIVNAAADSNVTLEKQLRPVYDSWSRAMLAKNYEAWKSATAYARQVETRNSVVSQKKAFPRAMFSVPMRPPRIAGLAFLSAKAKGPTATAVYFGRVDFEVGGNVPESLLVLRFLREGHQWKFYTLSMINQLPAELIRDVRANKLGFLKEPDFQPSGRPPMIQKECPKPDYVADLHVIGLGFQSEVTINGISEHFVSDDFGTQLVMGGLRKGKNTIQIKNKALGTSKSGRKYAKVTVHVKTGKKSNPIIQVFEFKPDPSKGPFTYSGNIQVDKATLGRRSKR